MALAVSCRPCVQNALSRSFISNTAALSHSHYSSCRDMHASHGSLVFNAREGQPYRALGFCVSTVNAKLAPAASTRPPRLFQSPLDSHPFRRNQTSISFSLQCREVVTDPQLSFTCPFIGKWKCVSLLTLDISRPQTLSYRNSVLALCCSSRCKSV